MQTDKGIAHFAFDFGARCQRGNRVDNHDVDRARAYERLRNVQTLLTGVRLGDQQAVNVNAECLGVNRVERVLGVDKRSVPPSFCASATLCSATVVLPEDSVRRSQ